MPSNQVGSRQEAPRGTRNEQREAPRASKNGARGGPRTRHSETGEPDGPGKPSKGPLIAVMAVLVVALLVIISLIGFFVASPAEGDTVKISTFSSGSDNILLGGKEHTLTGYVKLPKNAEVKDFRFNATGMLPNELERYDVGVEPLSIVADDLDVDGDQDIVVLNSGDSEVTVLKNLGAYGFVPSSYPAPPNSQQVITAYLNSDRYLDLAVVSTDEIVSVYLTSVSASGNWDFNYPSSADYTVDEFATSICAVDYDNDNDLDIVATCKNTDKLNFLENSGEGVFKDDGKVSTEHKPGEITSADLDGDGFEDLIVYNRGDTDHKLDGKSYRYTVSIFFNNRGLFDSHIDYAVDENPSGIVATDINSDGLIDIVVSNAGYGVDSVSVLLNQGGGLFPAGDGEVIGAKTYETLDPNDVICYDINGDGYPDVLTACRTTDSIAVLLNDGTGELEQYTQYFVGYSPKAIDCADFDGDGDLDVTSANMRALNTSGRLTGTVSIIKNHGYGVFSTDREYEVGNCPRGISTADYDNDGDLDISTANYFGSTLSVLPNDGQGKFGEQDTYLLGLEPYAVEAADFNGDGYLDIASADEARFVVILLFNDGTGRFKNERPYYNIGGYPFSLHADDYNGDGSMDVITANHGQGTLALLFNKGNGTFEDYYEIDLGPTRMPFDLTVKDVDGDGFKDIVTANLGTDNNYTNTISVLINKQDHTYYPPVDYTVGWGPTSVVVVDFDGDGDNDIASSNLADGSVSVLTNDGTGKFTLRSTLPIGWKPYFLEEFDFDDDGDFDIIATNSHSNSMSFLRNDGSGGFSVFYEKTTGSYPYQISVSDLDKDGREDIVVTNVNTASISLVSDYYYPTDVGIDLDRNVVTKEHSFSPGMLDGSERTPNLAKEVNEYLRKNKHLADEEGNVLVPITVVRSESGLVKLSDLVLEYEV